VQRNLASGFDDSFRRHLAVEQRRAVLDTIARELTPETTLGDIVDAAQDLGWGDSLGELRLADLAGALLGAAQSPAREGPVRAAVVADAGHAHDDHDDEDEDENDDEDARELADELDAASAVADEKDDEVEQDEEDQQEARETPKAARARKAAAKTAAKAAAKAAARIEAPRKPSSLDRALDRIDKALAARKKPEPRPTAKAKATPAAKKAAAKKVPAKKLSKKAPVPRPMDDDDDTDAMSLDQAAKVLVPLVRKLKEATMQDLEEQTGMGRRKLRFHIGQLVKHGRLKRHGMGRGTCYTVK